MGFSLTMEDIAISLDWLKEKSMKQRLFITVKYRTYWHAMCFPIIRFIGILVETSQFVQLGAAS